MRACRGHRNWLPQSGPLGMESHPLQGNKEFELYGGGKGGVKDTNEGVGVGILTV